MSIISAGGAVVGAGGAAAPYEIERSLRFNSADSAYLNRTIGSPTDADKFTISLWAKRSALGSGQDLWDAGPTPGTNDFDELYFNGNDQLDFLIYYSAAVQARIVSSAVFRDVGAWYHIVLAVDIQNATANDRLIMYVNNVRQTLSTNTTPTTAVIPRSGVSGNIGRIGQYIGNGEGNFFNGYITEYYFIDGSALDPTSFGEFNSTTGVWQPIEYTGSYGTNGFYLPMSAGTTWSGYFDGSNDYLSVASNAAWQYGTGDFTVECWLLGTSSGALSNQYPLGRYNTSAGAYGALQIGNSTTIYWYYGNGAAYTFTLGTALTTNQWYHFAVSRSGTDLRFFLNGTQVGSTQTDNTNYSGTAEFRIVNAHQTSATYFPGYISNVRVVKGSAVYTANFTPSTTPLTAITNTVLLTCQSSTFIDNSTNNFTITNNGGAITQLFSPFNYDATDDQSGNGNNWQPNNLDLVTTGVGADSLVDTPTPYGTDTGAGGEVRGNYCTFNSVKPVTNSITFSNGNLQYKPGSSWSTTTYVEGTIGILGGSTGKYYWEMSADQTGNLWTAGVALQNNTIGGSQIGTTGSVMIYDDDKYVNGTATGSYLTQLSANEVLGVALDAATGKVWFRDSGGFLGSGDPAAGTNETGIPTGFSGATLVPVSQANSASTVTANFGQRPFAYTAPSGFKALCTQNLPTPTIIQGDDYFNTILYTGTGSSNARTGVGFQPDFVWIKERSGAADHGLYDAVRGVQNQLESNTTTAETTEATGLTAFGSDGFTVGALAQLNTNTDTYVAWNWKANGSGVSNTDGTITSTVSANTDSGFSIVTYTANGTSGATVGHGLGVAPSMVVYKNRTSGGYDWIVYHASLGATKNLRLNTTTAQLTQTLQFNDTAPTSSVLTIGSSAGSTNGPSGNNYLAYCFAAISGYSAFGSYTGNGSADGPFVFTGFRPAYVLRKCSSATGDWFLIDATRSPYNVALLRLNANISDAESSGANSDIDILSNGFKIRAASTAGVNQSGQTHIYMAFAENPFKHSLAR